MEKIHLGDCYHSNLIPQNYKWRVPGVQRTIHALAMRCNRCGKIMMTHRQMCEFKETCESYRSDQSK